MTTNTYSNCAELEADLYDAHDALSDAQNALSYFLLGMTPLPLEKEQQIKRYSELVDKLDRDKHDIGVAARALAEVVPDDDCDMSEAEKSAKYTLAAYLQGRI